MKIFGNRKLLLFIFLILVSLALSGCVQPNENMGVPLEETGKIYGFWNGIWDSFCSGFAVFSNIFFGTKHGIYQSHNNGNWYDFGYIGGLGILITLFIRLPLQIFIFLRTGKL